MTCLAVASLAADMAVLPLVAACDKVIAWTEPLKGLVLARTARARAWKRAEGGAQSHYQLAVELEVRENLVSSLCGGGRSFCTIRTS